MGRSSDSKQVIKRNLEDYHLRSINTSEIFHALDRAQQDLATRYDLVRKVILLTMIVDQADYDIVATDSVNVVAGAFVVGTLYQITSVGTTNFVSIGANSNNVGVVFTATGSGSGDGIAQAAFRYVQRVKSMKVPQSWTPVIWKTDQQFDEILEQQPTVSRPQYVIFRNDVITFHGAPTTAAETVTLQTYLHTPVFNLSGTVNPEVPPPMDKAMEQYALWFLLPTIHPQKEYHWNKYNTFAESSFGVLHNLVSAPIVPRARW